MPYQILQIHPTSRIAVIICKNPIMIRSQHTLPKQPLSMVPVPGRMMLRTSIRTAIGKFVGLGGVQHIFVFNIIVP